MKELKRSRAFINLHEIEYMDIDTLPAPSKKRVIINEGKNEYFQTYSKYEYDRSPLQFERISKDNYKVILAEVNELKKTMEVHPDSKNNTLFYKL